MAEIFQSIEQLEIFFADLVTNILGMPEKNVLLQYREQGQISSKYNEDVAYIKVTPETDERAIFKNRKSSYNEATEQFTYTQQSSRTVTMHVVFYGPNCYNNCYKFNELMYTENVKLELKKNYLNFVPDRTVGPIRFPEMHNGKWWPRSDIELRFYNTLAIEETVNSFSEFDIRTEVD